VGGGIGELHVIDPGSEIQRYRFAHHREILVVDGQCRVSRPGFELAEKWKNQSEQD
jgi:hypothetical protein